MDSKFFPFACNLRQTKARKTIPDSRPKWTKSILFSDQNGAKTLPFGVAHTYMAI